MIVVLAEKPGVARDIAAVLGASQKKPGYFEGNGYQITYAFGHLVTIAEPEEMNPSWGGPWRMEQLPMIPTIWKYRVADKAQDQFNCIKKLILHPATKEIICATDAGREGQHIFDLIYQLTGSSTRSTSLDQLFNSRGHPRRISPPETLERLCQSLSGRGLACPR